MAAADEVTTGTNPAIAGSITITPGYEDWRAAVMLAMAAGDCVCMCVGGGGH